VVEVEVENAPHKTPKDTEIEGGSQKIEACRDVRTYVSITEVCFINPKTGLRLRLRIHHRYHRFTRIYQLPITN